MKKLKICHNIKVKLTLIKSGVLFDDVKLVKKLSDFVRQIWVKPQNEEWRNITVLDSFATSSYLLFDSYCFTLSNELANGHLELFFYQISGVKSINLYFLDTLRFVHRAMPEHELDYIGGKQMQVSAEADGLTQFNIKISQEINVEIEEDSSQSCRNYPYSTYGSFDECDTAYVLNKMRSLFGVNFTPLWAAENNAEVKTQFIHVQDFLLKKANTLTYLPA